MTHFAVDTAGLRPWHRRLALWIGVARDVRSGAVEVAEYLLQSNKAGLIGGVNVDGSPMAFQRPIAEGTRRKALIGGLGYRVDGGQVTLGWSDPKLRQQAEWLAAGHGPYTVRPVRARALRIPIGGGSVIFRKSAHIPAAPPRQLLGLRPGDERQVRRILVGRFQ